MKKEKKKSPKKSKGASKSAVVKFQRHSVLGAANEPTVSSNLGRPREWTEGLIEQKRKALEKWIANPKNYFITSFMAEQDLHHEQISRFCNYSDAFRATYARAQLIQEQRIVEAALTRKFDSTFAKFVLQNKAGWKEKQEVSGDAANPLAIIMDRIAQSARDPLDYDLE